MQFFDQLKQAYLVVDTVNFDLVYLNASAQQLLKLDQAQIGVDLWRQMFLASITRACQKGGANFIFQRQHFDIEASPLEHEGQSYWALFLKLSQAEKQDVDYFYSLLDNLGAYVYCKDQDYKYTYVNRLVCRLFERDYDDVIGKCDSELFNQETADSLIENADAAVVIKGKTIQQEERNYLPNLGEYRDYFSIKKPLYDNTLNKRVPNGLFGVSMDITEIKQLQKRNRDNEQKLSSIINNAGAFIFIKDRFCRFKYVNKRTEELFGMSSDEILGKDNFELLGPVQGEIFDATDKQVFSGGEKLSCIETFDTDDGPNYFWTVKVPLENEQGEIDSYIGISTDITEQKLLENNLRQVNNQLEQKVGEITRLKDKLHQQASHDALTGLYNRGYFEQHNGVLLANKSQQHIALLVIDVDDFKLVNDTYGHIKGDEVLVFLAHCLQHVCRQEDLVCRFGGEEFLILFSANEAQAALNKAHRIREQFAAQAQQQFNDFQQPLTISVGVACSNQSELSFKDLYQAADVAMYQAKRCGKNACVLAEN